MKHIKEFKLNENTDFDIEVIGNIPENPKLLETTEKRKKDFDKFITGLEKLSKTYGFALSVTGGIIWHGDEKILDIEYSRDLLSGDIGIEGIKWSSDSDSDSIKEIVESIEKVDDFFNKLAKEIDKKYFPDVKYYRDNKDDADAHYAIELFNNGVIGYDSLIKKLSKSCKDKKENIQNIVNKYIKQ
jgi:hypothetical protein